MRPGEFSGERPGPIQVNIPQTPELAEAAQQTNATLNSVSRIQRLRATRQWSVDLQSLNGDAILDSGLSASVALPVWQQLADALNMTTPDKESNWRRRFNGTGPLADDSYLYSAYDATAVVTTVSLFVGTLYRGAGLVAADVSNLLVVADGEMDIQPIGPSGPSLRVTGGFHRFERTCTPDGQQAFVEVALDTPIDLVQIGWVDALAAAPDNVDYAVATCGIDVGSSVDLGAVAAPLPLIPKSNPIFYALPLSVRSLAWSPGSDGLFLLSDAEREGFSSPPYAQINHLVIGESATTLVTSGDLQPPVTVATSGTSLLYWVNQASAADYIRLSLNDKVLPLQAALPTLYGQPLDLPESIISPDGNLLAAAKGPFELSQFVDLRTMSLSSLALPEPYNENTMIPRAWAPTGDAILMEIPSNSPQSYGEGTFIIVPLILTDGLPTDIGQIAQVKFPDSLPIRSALVNTQYRPTSLRYFWSATGPQVLIQDAEGARVCNFITQQCVLFVEADRVAPPTAAIDVAVATDQVFAWATQCFGIGEINCRDELRRLSLATGTIERLATADQPWMFAVAPNGKQIAFADTANIYIKTIAP